MSDYQVVRRVLLQEKGRREGYYRYRPAQRDVAMQEIAGALASLERLRKKAEWRDVGKWWQDKFD